jgi:hypothetical protein
MTITLCIDEHDQLATPLHLQALHSLEQRTLVVHTIVGGGAPDLARGLLASMGFSKQTPGWPGRTQRALALSTAWVYGYEIELIVIYGAWRLHQHALRWLDELAARTGTAITLITCSGFPNYHLLKDVATSEESIESLFGLADEREQAERPCDASESGGIALERILPPLPAAPMATFIAEVGALLEDSADFSAVVHTFARVYERTLNALRADRSREAFCAHLAELHAAAKSMNDIIIQVRAAQAAALIEGIQVELDLQQHCQIAYPRHATGPSCHDAQTLAERAVDPRFPAAAAVAITTGVSCEILRSLCVADFDPSTATITVEGDALPVPAHLSAPVRAQHFRQREQKLELLFARGDDRCPSAHGIRGGLDRFLPRAVAATTRGRSADAYDAAIRCWLPVDEDLVAREPPEGTQSIQLPADSISHWVGQFSSSFDQIVRRAGLASKVTEGAPMPYPPHYRYQQEALRLLSGMRSTPERGSDDEEPLERDVRFLHAVLVQHGGRVSRGDLYHALHWTADRTERTLTRLKALLAPISEVIAEEPPDYIMLRSIDDPAVTQTLRAVSRRSHERDGLTQRAAKLLRERILAHPEALSGSAPADAHERRASSELCRAGLANIQNTRLVLSDAVTMTLIGSTPPPD